MKKIKKVMTAALSIVLTVCLCSTMSYAKEEKEGAAGDFMPEYYHYEKTDFDPLVTDITKAAKEKDEKALIRAYDAAYEEILKIEDLYQSIHLAYSDDVTNKETDKELQYTENLVDDCEDLFSTAMNEALDAGEFKEFKKHIGDDLYEYYKDYEPVPENIKEIKKRIIDLETDYYKAMNGLGEMTVEINGESVTFDDYNSEKAEELAAADPVNYMFGIMKLEKQFNDIVGPIYTEMVGLRDKLADYYGYDNYAEYAYKEVYSRDYTLEDAEAFCNTVKEKIAPIYYELVYYGNVSDSGIEYDSNIENLMQDLEYLAKEISPISESAYKKFSEEKLYDLGYDSKRIESSFTSVIPSTSTPYVFTHFSDSMTDLLTLTHEFGHFSYFAQSKVPAELQDTYSLDLMEMHSNGFELLGSKYYEKFFGDQAEMAEASVIGEVLYNIISGCIQDEFQRKVYADPDMTLEEMNRLYASIASEYGELTFGSEAYEWSLIPHNFESPMYYLSYAVSAVTALEIWDISRDDYEEGVKAWEDIVKYTDENEGYLKTLKKCGLTPITDSEGVCSICSDAFTRISEITGQSVSKETTEPEGLLFDFMRLLFGLVA